MYEQKIFLHLYCIALHNIQYILVLQQIDLLLKHFASF